MGPAGGTPHLARAWGQRSGMDTVPLGLMGCPLGGAAHHQGTAQLRERRGEVRGIYFYRVVKSCSSARSPRGAETLLDCRQWLHHVGIRPAVVLASDEQEWVRKQLAEQKPKGEETPLEPDTNQLPPCQPPPARCDVLP